MFSEGNGHWGKKQAKNHVGLVVGHMPRNW